MRDRVECTRLVPMEERFYLKLRFGIRSASDQLHDRNNYCIIFLRSSSQM
jgi:hypothetical protein